MATEQNDLVITRTINAPRSIVWKAWTDPEHLVEWWCPKPWKTELRGFDLRPGGTFHTYMFGPDGEGSDNPGSFLEVVPEERIVFTSSLIEGWRPTTPSFAMTAFITMEDDAGKTKYTARVLHKDEADRKKHEDMGFHDGWGTCIDQLNQLAEQLS